MPDPQHALLTPQELADASAERWRELLRVPALSVGVYTLEAGAEDTQSPHREDEIYVVLEGRALLRVGGPDDGEDLVAEPGAVLYVAAHADHRFHAIEERLRLLVVFAPAET